MKIMSSFGVIVECFIYDTDAFEFLVRHPNGHPMAYFADVEDLGSYLSDLRSNVIANSTLNSQSAKED